MLAQEGSFMFRLSSKPGQLAFSYMSSGVVKHSLLEIVDSHTYKFENSSFNSLSEFAKHLSHSFITPIARPVLPSVKTRPAVHEPKMVDHRYISMPVKYGALPMNETEFIAQGDFAKMNKQRYGAIEGFAPPPEMNRYNAMPVTESFLKNPPASSPRYVAMKL